MSKISVIAAVLLLVTAGCGGADDEGSGGGGDGMSLSISSPDDGAQVSVPFTVELDSSVPLDDPDTGEHHVHVYFDGDDSEYILVYGDSIEVDELPAGVTEGQHVMNASLRNADHSAAGVETDIDLTIGTSGDGGASDGGDDAPDYSY